MYLKNIKLTNFRNYNKLTVSFNKGINIIYGENAQGKTNLLESIYVLGITKSHRNINEISLIKQNSNYFFIKGKLKKDKFYTDLEVYADDVKKILKKDSDVIKKVSDYISSMNIIIFTPDDLDIIKSSPQIRRKFLDTEISQLYSDYYIVNNDYKKLLKMRNDYFKKIIKGKKLDKVYLDTLTSILIDKSIIIYKMRKKFIDKINLYCNKIYKDIMKLAGFRIVYRCSCDIDLNSTNLKGKIFKKYQDKYDIDLRLAATSIGPHKDDFEFYLDDLNIKLYGSQGQQRVAVLTLKLSEIEIFRNYKHNTPILLLDDIFSEIDNEKKNNLIKYIKKDIQTIITTTDLNNIDDKTLESSKIFKIHNGKITREVIK